MFGRGKERNDIVIGLAATLSVIAVFVLYTHRKPAELESPAASAQARTIVVALDATLVSIKPPEHSRATDAAPPIATVFECAGPQGRVLSDRPCGDDTTVVEVPAPNGMLPARVPNRSNSPSPNNLRAQTLPSAAAPNARNDALCAHFESEIDRINARMRSAYTSQEGEWFRQQLRDLSDRRWQANCRK